MFQYSPENYPPRGRIWPLFGDEALEETLSLSEGARRNLSRKKDGMGDFHKEILQHHGLAPRPDDNPPPNAPQYREEHAWPDELYTYVRRGPAENVTMTVPATQPPPPPDGPRIAQDRL